MTKRSLIFLPLFILYCSSSYRIPVDIQKAFPVRLTLKVHNPLHIPRQDAAFQLDIQTLKMKAPGFNEKNFLVWSGSQELPSQAIDTDGDGYLDHIVVIADVNPLESKRLIVCFNRTGAGNRTYPKRTQAEVSCKTGGSFVNKKYIGGAFQNVQFLKPPPEHTDHDEFIRYEGPGWESDRVGYRFYLDWRNATDIYGKKTTAMVLQDVGQDGYESYHSMSSWGMDVLKVGESLGIGSIGMWSDDKAVRVTVTDSVSCQIVCDGPVYSQIRTNYYGWRLDAGVYDLTSDLAIGAGSRMTMQSLAIRGNPDNLCTGLVKDDNAQLFKSDGSGWAYIATWGKQSLADDNLGMALLYHNKDLMAIADDANSHVVVLKPDDGRLTYAFLAAWEQEPDGIRSVEEFVKYLGAVIMELDNPLTVEY